MKFYKYMAVSALGHVIFFALFYSLVLLWKNSALSVIDIDLTGSSLLLRPFKSAEKMPVVYNPANDWFIGDNVKRVIAVQTAKTPVPEDKSVYECPPPCPTNPSDWIDSGSLSRRPVWAQGMITEDDYPQDVRQQGKEGSVKVEVLIDAQGTVRDVKILQSNDSRFTELVTEKLKKARFEPALDKTGRPAAVRMVLPIVFELR
jgi:TonB family protein